MLKFEEEARLKGYRFIIGVDEAGRGPLAGPVVSAAVMLKSTAFQNKIDDSKKMSDKQRERAFMEIFENGYVGLGIMSESVIDTANILQATFFSMANAVRQLVQGLPQEVSRLEAFNQQVLLLIDGPHFKSDLPYANRPIIDGDAQSLSIACASIVAKVYRDRILKTYDAIYPEYGFKAHKGYPTRAHRLAIQNIGLSPIHRRSFQVKTVTGGINE